MWSIQKHDCHIINIKDVEGGAFPKGSNYHNTLFNPKTKEKAFALFIRVVESCLARERGNYNGLSFANTCKCNIFLWMTQNSSNNIKQKYHNGVNIKKKNILI